MENGFNKIGVYFLLVILLLYIWEEYIEFVWYV